MRVGFIGITTRSFSKKYNNGGYVLRTGSVLRLEVPPYNIRRHKVRVVPRHPGTTPGSAPGLVVNTEKCSKILSICESISYLELSIAGLHIDAPTYSAVKVFYN